MENKYITILLAENSITEALTVEQLLTDEGFNVIHIDNLEKAIVKVHSSHVPIDLILIDLDLLEKAPDKIQWTWETLKNNDIPVLFHCGGAGKEVFEKTEQITSYGFVIKGSPGTVIVSSIKSALKLHRQNKYLRAQESQLRKSEASLSVTLHSIGDGVIATDKNGYVVHMNPIAERLCGWNFNEAKGRVLSEVFHIINVKSRELIINPVEKVLKTGRVIGLSNHTVLISRDGTEYQISDSASPIRNEAGEQLGVVLVFSDVTDKYKNEAALRESEEMFRSTFENATAGICLTGPDGRFFRVNTTLCKMLGYSVEELKSKSFNDITYPEDKEIGLNFLKDLVANKIDNANFEKRYMDKNGQIIWCYLSIAIVRDESSKPKYFITHIQDISKRKKAEEDLIRAKKEAEKSDKLKSEFLAQMSHEIRSPISTMLNFISLIKEEVPKPLNEEMIFSFNAIDSSSRRLIRTIDLILNMSQVQTGYLECNYQMIDLGKDVLDKIINEYSTSALLKGLTLSISNESGTERINADSYTVIQIFSNLINNAIKYTRSGQITVRLYRDHEDNISVDVSDTGIGISEDYINQIFTPFSQEEQGYTRKFEGNGLGLALVKKYCELNNAKVSVKSKKGEGSTFTVTFFKHKYHVDPILRN